MTTDTDRMCLVPVDDELRRDKGRGYCGRRSGLKTSDLRLVNCLDCHAAIRADNHASKGQRR